MGVATRSLEQERASYAWQRVKGHQENGDFSSDYVNLAKGAPALIMGNGLMQTLAFYQAKNKPHHKALLGDVLGWLHGQDLVVSPAYTMALKSLAASDSASYLAATEEALEILRWIRQLADAAAKAGA